MEGSAEHSKGTKNKIAMAGQINAINRSNGKPATFTKEQWEKIQKDPEWRHVFKEVEKVEKPKEVKDLEAKQAQTKADPNDGVEAKEEPKQPQQKSKAKGK